MKKIVSFIVATLIIISVSFSANAEENGGTIYEINDTMIQFQENSVFSKDEQEVIVDYLINGDDGIEPCNLLCSIFGHKYESETVTAITHKVRTTAPRCLKEFFTISVCSRCDDKKSELTKSEYINCCP